MSIIHTLYLANDCAVCMHSAGFDLTSVFAAISRSFYVARTVQMSGGGVYLQIKPPLNRKGSVLSP